MNWWHTQTLLQEETWQADRVHLQHRYTGAELRHASYVAGAQNRLLQNEFVRARATSLEREVFVTRVSCTGLVV